MDFKTFFFNRLSTSVCCSVDDFLVRYNNNELRLIDHIDHRVVDLTVGFNDDMVFTVSKSTPIEMFKNDPVRSGVAALSGVISVMPMTCLIKYGFIQYKHKRLIPNKQLEISIIYSEIPNIVPFSSITNDILLRNYESYSVADSSDQLELFTKHYKTITYENSNWNIITDVSMDNHQGQQIKEVLNKLCK